MTIEAIPVGVQAFTPEQARDATDRVKSNLSSLTNEVIELWICHADRALGYESWDDYIRAEFGGVPIRLPAEERRVQVKSMRDAGMPTRAIAVVTGTTHQTAINDGKKLANHEHGNRYATRKPDEDKRLRARTALLDDPYTSDRAIAKCANVSASLVADVRADMIAGSELPERFARGTKIPSDKFDKVAAALRESPHLPDSVLCEPIDVDVTTVRRIRKILLDCGEIPYVSRESRQSIGRQAKLTPEGFTEKQLCRAANRFIDANEISLEAIVFAMEDIDPSRVDYAGKREQIAHMLHDVGRIRQFLNRCRNTGEETAS